jgi:hypothetical protein
MRYQLCVALLPLFSHYVFGAPQKRSTVEDRFTDSTIPFLSTTGIPFFNNHTRTKVHHDHADDSPKVKRELIELPWILCNITMNGRNQGNQHPFEVVGKILITKGIPLKTTPNGVNPYDIVIEIGDPTVESTAGYIHYATNKYLDQFIGGPALNSNIDYTYVTAVGDSVSFTVDNRTAMSNHLNNFESRTGLNVPTYIIDGGSFYINFTDVSAVAGFVNFVGREISAPITAQYKASFIGTVTSRGAHFF